MARTVRDHRLDSREARKSSRLPASHTGACSMRACTSVTAKGRAAADGLSAFTRANEHMFALETIGSADDGAMDARRFEHPQLRPGAGEGPRKSPSRAGMASRLGATPPQPNTPSRHVSPDYLDWMEHNRKSAQDARYRVKALVLPELGEIACERLTAEKIQGWLRDVAKNPARLRSKVADGKIKKQNIKAASDDPEAARKRRASANRTLTILKAALNRAWRDGRIASDAAWRRLEPFEEADAARVRYLTIAEAKRLINAAAADFRRLVRAALATGARYGELAGLQGCRLQPGQRDAPRPHQQERQGAYRPR